MSSITIAIIFDHAVCEICLLTKDYELQTQQKLQLICPSVTTASFTPTGSLVIGSNDETIRHIPLGDKTYSESTTVVSAGERGFTNIFVCQENYNKKQLSAGASDTSGQLTKLVKFQYGIAISCNCEVSVLSIPELTTLRVSSLHYRDYKKQIVNTDIEMAKKHPKLSSVFAVLYINKAISIFCLEKKYPLLTIQPEPNSPQHALEQNLMVTWDSNGDGLFVLKRQQLLYYSIVCDNNDNNKHVKTFTLSFNHNNVNAKTMCLIDTNNLLVLFRDHSISLIQFKDNTFTVLSNSQLNIDINKFYNNELDRSYCLAQFGKNGIAFIRIEQHSIKHHIVKPNNNVTVHIRLISINTHQ